MMPGGSETSSEEERPSSGTLVKLADELRNLNERLLISSVREQASAEAAEQRTAQLRALLEALSEGVVIVEPLGPILMMNGAARRILGIESGLALHSMAQLNALDVRGLDNAAVPDHRRPLNRAIQGEAFVDAEVAVVRADGETRRVMTSGTSIMDRGKVGLAILVFRDVTDVRRLEQQREEYLALISHDLRGPLGAVALLAGSLKALADEGGGPSQKMLDRISRIEKNTARVSAMLTELLETTSLEGHAALRQRAPCNLGELIGGAIDRLDDVRRDRVSFEIVGDAFCVVLADPDSLERAFGNLLTNALKYSSDKVRVRLERRGHRAAIEVVDQGIGIAPESVPHLFDRYYRTLEGQRHTEGLGLGLYITRLIAERHGGHVEVRTVLGKGSTFVVLLPLHYPA
jgi:PAS domain S-box-containing protein